MLFQEVKSSDPSGSRCTSDGMLEFVVVLELSPRATSMVSSKPRMEAYGVERTSSVRRTFWAMAAVAKRTAVKLALVNIFAIVLLELKLARSLERIVGRSGTRICGLGESEVAAPRAKPMSSKNQKTKKKDWATQSKQTKNIN